jgi:Uncharacterized protein conserved in bacteria
MKADLEAYLTANLPDGIFVVDITVGKNNSHINIYLDGDAGLNVDTCGKVSRELETWLDEANQIPQQYTLNVSSAGVDQPLNKRRQFRKNVNRNLKVKTLTTEYTAKLVLVDNDNLVLKTDKGKAVPLAFEDVKDARVEI